MKIMLDGFLYQQVVTNLNCIVKGTMLKYCGGSYHICCTDIFSGFHVNKFSTKLEPNIELNPSSYKSVRRKMFDYTLFLYAISL